MWLEASVLVIWAGSVWFLSRRVGRNVKSGGVVSEAALEGERQSIDAWPILQGFAVLLLIIYTSEPSRWAPPALQVWLPEPHGLIAFACVAVQFIPSPGVAKTMRLLAVPCFPMPLPRPMRQSRWRAIP